MRKAAGLGDTLGALPVANGGTGATTQKAAEFSIVNPVSISSISSTSEVVVLNPNASTTNGRLGRVKVSELSSIIKNSLYPDVIWSYGTAYGGAGVSSGYFVTTDRFTPAPILNSDGGYTMCYLRCLVSGTYELKYESEASNVSGSTVKLSLGTNPVKFSDSINVGSSTQINLTASSTQNVGLYVTLPSGYSPNGRTVVEKATLRFIG